MIGLIQRVDRTEVTVGLDTVGQIDTGILVFLSIEKNDTKKCAKQLLNKILNYRIFADELGKLNLNIQQIKGSLLVVSQFTLAANTQKGNRPSFSEACSPDKAQILYEYFVQEAKQQIHTATGKFGANMQVSLTNNGPVTFYLKF